MTRKLRSDKNGRIKLGEAMDRIPKKLKDDPILEGVFEIRFSSGEVPEIVVGKLATARWSSGRSTRLPTADIPQPIRHTDPNLRVQAILQIEPHEGGRLTKIGDHMLSYHVLRPYPGWDVYYSELEKIIDDIFNFQFLGFTVERLGFRYINGLKSEVHGISRVDDLNIEFSVDGHKFERPININYATKARSLHRGIVKIASREFIIYPDQCSPDVLIDVDIFTPDQVDEMTRISMRNWVTEAHEALKEEFFALFTSSMADKLVEEW